MCFEISCLDIVYASYPQILFPIYCFEFIIVEELKALSQNLECTVDRDVLAIAQFRLNLLLKSVNENVYTIVD